MNLQDQKQVAEKTVQTLQPRLKTIDPDLQVSAERRVIEPLEGDTYLAWVLLFKCRNLVFSMEPTTDIEAIKRVFIKASGGT